MDNINDGISLFTNCFLLKNHQIIKEDLWIENGKILDPEPIFFDQKRQPVRKIDCKGALITAGLIDIQINGGFGVDFSADITDKTSAENALKTVSQGILQHGVTSYCPTLVTSPPEVYHNILPYIKKTKGGPDGASILGVHVEGPFISKKKKGAHPEDCIVEDIKDFSVIEKMYGQMDDICIITLAPENDVSGELVVECVKRGITVSLGHSMATLPQGEEAVRNGASLMTHLFNAMASFHHRDPGLVGLLTSKYLEGHEVYYGIIADGIHTHPAALRIAYKTNYEALVLVTDAICAMGLKDGTYKLGQHTIEVHGERAVVAGTDTLCGASASLITCIKKFIKEARCTDIEALEAASLHPAKSLGITDRKGTLDYGTDADFVMFDRRELNVKSTWIAGNCVYDSEKKSD